MSAVSVGLLTSLDAQVFKVATELVTVPVSVTQRQADRADRADRIVAPLSAADFRVFEDDLEQTDSSLSMEADRRLMARFSTETAIAELAPGWTRRAIRCVWSSWSPMAERT